MLECEMTSYNLFLSVIKRTGLKTSSLVWIDDLINQNVKKKLQSLINHVEIFQSIAECKTFILELEDDDILLIISEHVGFTVVPYVHSLRKITEIYIYCLDCQTKQCEWTFEFNKIRGVVFDFNELVELIEIYSIEPLSISIYNSVLSEERSSTNIDGGFLHYQLLIDSLLHHDCTKTNRKEFFNFCRKQYENNHVQLSILKELEQSYVPEKALYYYTRHSFLYRMLNRASRIQDIRIMRSLQFFIHDLYQQLKVLQREQHELPTRVYRGQVMSKQEVRILKNSQGQFISMNSFLSTSLDRQISLLFVSSESNDLYHVLFEIDIDSCSSYRVKPFANISLHSHFVNEQEILFTIATVSRLVRVYQENEIVIVRMELNENYSYDMKILFGYMRKEVNGYLSLGQLLYNAGKYDEAEQFYQQMLIRIVDDDPLIGDLWAEIGRVKKAKGELEISSKWLNTSLKVFRRTRNQRGLANCIQDLAHIHQIRGEFDQAIKKYAQALNIFKELFGYQNKSVANCLNSLGTICFEQHRFTQAIECYIDALKIQEIVLPQIHTDIGYTFNNIGNVYFVENQCDRALEFFQRTLDIFKKSLPSEHPSIAKTYCNMGLTYFKKHDCQLALIFLERATSIYQTVFSSNHPDVSRCKHIIEFIEHRTR